MLGTLHMRTEVSQPTSTTHTNKIIPVFRCDRVRTCFCKRWRNEGVIFFTDTTQIHGGKLNQQAVGHNVSIKAQRQCPFEYQLLGTMAGKATATLSIWRVPENL